MDYSVIVIGTGGAGTIAAMAAADAGAKVLNLEKMPEPGGVWSYRGGTFTACQTKLQIKSGILGDSPDLYYTDMLRWPTSRAWASSEVLRYYVDHCAAAIDWLEGQGAFAPPWDKTVTGMYGDLWSVPRSHGDANPIYRYLKPVYQKYLERGDITLKTSTAVLSLIEKDGAIIGVKARGEDGRETVYRAGAVVICTGGYAANPGMLKQNLPKAQVILSHAREWSTGDGHSMCEKAGAAMVNMDHTFESGPYGGGVPDPSRPNREIAHINMFNYPGAIWVSNEGKRMVREDIGGYLPPLREALAKAPGIMMNAILDSRMRSSNKTIFMAMFDTPERSWEWFDQKAAEGVIVKKANSLEELAGKLNLPVTAFLETVRKWNAAIDAGKDEEFGRTDLKTKLENPPYFGIATNTIAIGSTGGPAVNSRQEVLQPGGKVIAGLYAAGEVAGYRAHGTGCFHTGNLVFGRQAGYQAAVHAQMLRS